MLLSVAQSRSLLGDHLSHGSHDESHDPLHNESRDESHDESRDESCGESHDESRGEARGESCDESHDGSCDESCNEAHDESHEAGDICTEIVISTEKRKRKENVQIKKSPASFMHHCFTC